MMPHDIALSIVLFFFRLGCFREFVLFGVDHLDSYDNNILSQYIHFFLGGGGGGLKGGCGSLFFSKLFTPSLKLVSNFKLGPWLWFWSKM